MKSMDFSASVSLNNPPLRATRSAQTLCYYFNNTNKLQLLRSANIPGWHFERAIFPRERLMFEALPDALLEIYESAPTGTNLLEVLPCADLYVNED